MSSNECAGLQTQYDVFSLWTNPKFRPFSMAVAFPMRS